MASNRNPHVGSGVRAGRPAPSVPSGAATPDESLPHSPRGPVDGWVRFWFTPVNPIGLHCLRVLSGLLFIVWLLPFAGQVDAFFGAQGWVDREAYRQMSRDQLEQLGQRLHQKKSELRKQIAA